MALFASVYPLSAVCFHGSVYGPFAGSSSRRTNSDNLWMLKANDVLRIQTGKKQERQKAPAEGV